MTKIRYFTAMDHARLLRAAGHQKATDEERNFLSTMARNNGDGLCYYTRRGKELSIHHGKPGGGQ